MNASGALLVVLGIGVATQVLSVLVQEGPSRKTAGLAGTLASVIERALSPGVAAIPDYSAGTGGGGEAAGAARGATSAATAGASSAGRAGTATSAGAAGAGAGAATAATTMGTRPR